MSSILFVDQSTSATKPVLFGERGKVLEKAALSLRQIYPQPGWVDHNPGGFWSLNDPSALPRNPTEFKPQMSQSKVKQLHAQWLAAVERVL